ncbi:MAG: DUF5702 domain-containing protein [Clostridiales Family XIII bacterium]|jgi:hypothetical protein|nr:DUF5702 domain-containing protein [Clostridiales Family XIII bacterium]
MLMIRGKRGSTSVFLAIALASMLVVAGVLVRAAGLSAGRSYGDAVFQMAGRSLLSEYDRRLYHDYGIFGLRADESSARAKLLHYSDASLERKSAAGRRTVWLMPCEASGLEVDLKEFSLLNPDVFERQALSDIKYVMANRLAEGLTPAKKAPASAAKGDAGDREINNQVVLGNLPSKGLGGGGPSVPGMLAAGLPSASDLLGGSSKSFLLSEYLLARFSHGNGGSSSLAENHESFYENEIEYLLAGKSSDKANIDAVKAKLRLLRFALNEVSIHTDREKMSQASNLASYLASILPPTPLTPFLGEMIIAVWTVLETGNDLKLIEAGEKVALVKNPRQWAIGIDAVPGVIVSYIKGFRAVEGSDVNVLDVKDQAEAVAGGSGPISPEDRSGFSYRDYLRLFLYFTGRETKLLRAMDLIQINMKAGYYGDFLMQEHYAGLRYSVTMNGDDYSYTQRYNGGEG